MAYFEHRTVHSTVDFIYLINFYETYNWESRVLEELWRNGEATVHFYIFY